MILLKINSDHVTPLIKTLQWLPISEWKPTSFGWSPHRRGSGFHDLPDLTVTTPLLTPLATLDSVLFSKQAFPWKLPSAWNVLPPRELHGVLPQLLQVSFLGCHPPSDARPVHPTKTASLSLALPTPFPAFSIRIDHLLIQYQIYIFGLCLSSPIRL